MMTISTPQNQKKLLLLFFVLFTFITNAQIGIGTVTPNASSILDITSTTQGMLPPRMTTAQRIAIASPAEGLMVYDLTLKSVFYYATGNGWLPLVNGSSSRLNYKLIKSTDVLATVLATEKTAGGGTKYLMDANTLYEINGTIALDLPIEINNSYIVGQDANGDVLSRSGGIFVGATGGSIKTLTLSSSAGSVFSLSGAATQSLLMRDCIIASSQSVGSISGFGLTFFSVIQFLSNANGITFDNINYALLSNLAWFSSNAGTFEKYTGTFTLIEKQGGFSQVTGTAVGIDVSNNPVINGDAVLESVVFTGTTTGAGAYVKGYTAGSYTGYSFNNNWNVRSAGIPTESDTNATGDFSVDYAVGSGINVTFNSSNPSNIVKIGGVGTTYTTSNLFRFSAPSSDPARLLYQGKKKRVFQIAGSVSFQVPFAGTYIIYIAKNGTVLTQYKIYGRGTATSDIVVLPVNGTAELANGDYIEIYAQRYSGLTGPIVVPNMTITLK
ncbi:hypothetical protein [Flavobacterium sp. HTF]|uniref:hypothetical protein n=1 Tax=Flavobacterium sp. HTF TaxID=2170732 RepID=UPI001FAE837E|nr:hypothetical protein [Flavobacterium sp. HTF]